MARANGKVAPSASVIGSSSSPMPNACVTITGVNDAAGSATCAATINGTRVAVNHAAALAAIAETTSIDDSHSAGRSTRRARRVPSADPIANPLMNAAAIVANA